MARRGSEWIDTLIGFNVVSGTTSLGFNTPSAGGSTEGYTCVRTILSLSLTPTVTPTNDGVQQVDIGIGVATFDAIGAGAIPSPNVVSERPIGDWMYRERRLVVQGNTEIMQPTHIVADLRGPRKLAGGNMFIVVINTALIGTTFTVTFNGLARCLLLRP